MVHKEDIEIIVDNVVSNLKTKCPTISEMHDMLASKSYDDQYRELQENGYLNPLEEADYDKKRERLKDLDDYFDSHGTDDLMGAEVSMYQEREDIVDELFQYGRRLIEGYETSLPVNLDDYKDKAGQRDYQYPIDSGNARNSEDVYNTMGYMEREQIELQKQSVKVDPNDLTWFDNNGVRVPRMNDKRLLSMDNYFDGDTNHINYEISHNGYLNRVDTETRKHIKNIDSLMEESPGLKYNTLLFRGGHFNIHTRVGETISFKGYQSTSFQQSTAQSYKDDSWGDNMLYLIHAPKGTKGIVGNDDRFYNGFMEHEYVLPRNTKMKVIRIDYENQVCEVVIDE